MLTVPSAKVPGNWLVFSPFRPCDTRHVLRGRVRLLLVLTCVHFMVAMGSMMYAMAAGIARFHGPQSEPGVTEIAASLVGDVLLAPGLFIWSSWASQNLPNAFEWLLMVA